jgi:cell division septal protein FtsQ
VDNAEQAQREAERAALRNVRKVLDQLEDSEVQRRRLLRRVVAVCAVLLVVGGVLVWGIFFSGERMPKSAPLKIPESIKFKPS